MKVLAVMVIVGFAAAYAETCQEKKDRMLAEVKRGPNGMLPMGFHTPTCLKDGSYAPVQCMEAGCSCVSAEGVDLIPWRRVNEEMNCLCIRIKHETAGLMGAEHNCDPQTGNYLPRQCKGSMCYCVDPRGKQLGDALPRQDSNMLDC
uniref:Thyroglobulin type-1 repeat containing protein 2 n=1 Tax=Pinctada fucata TaxID=50426 RepID=A0A3G2LJ50_PINFU|nr:thyroglobulin type-1 repeat containing protein 2 [Pinctada fucata]